MSYSRARILHVALDGSIVALLTAVGANRVTKLFRADHVGSLIRPDNLIPARQAAAKGEIAAAELTRVQREATTITKRWRRDIYSAGLARTMAAVGRDRGSYGR